MNNLALKARLSGGGIVAMPVDMPARARLQENHQSSARVLLVLGVLFALLAVLNVTALTSWHTALLVHDDVVADAATLVHDHDADSEAEFKHTGERPDSPAIDLHNLTHAMAHGLTGLVPGMELVVPGFQRLDHWFAGRNFALAGIAPEGLMRPPRG